MAIKNTKSAKNKISLPKSTVSKKAKPLKKSTTPSAPKTSGAATTVKKTRSGPVLRSMPIGEIVTRYPRAAEVMLAYGLHCIGCHVSAYETLEQGAKAHGMPDAMIDKMVSEINARLTKTIETIDLTPKAVATIKRFQKEDKKERTGLRIAVVPGCCGLGYDMSFAETPAKDDKVFTFGGLKVFVPIESYPLIKGSEIDYVETPLESGFRIENPNTKKNDSCCGGSDDSCGCGVSGNDSCGCDAGKNEKKKK